MSFFALIGGKILGSIVEYGLETFGLGRASRAAVGVATEIATEELFRFPPVFLNASELRLLKRAVQDFSHSVFPFRKRVDDALEDLDRRAKAMSGKPCDLSSFFEDRIDSSGIETGFDRRVLADEVERHVGRLCINCSPASAGGILMAEKLSQICPVAEYEISRPIGSDQMPRVLAIEPEVAILANTPYFSSSYPAIRKNYVLYAPLHKSFDFLMTKAEPKALLQPVHRQMVVIPESSGEERRRMGMVQGYVDGGYLEAHSAGQIDALLNPGQAVPIWDPLAWGLGKQGFQQELLGTDATWLSIFLHKKLVEPGREHTLKRRSIMRLIASTWRELTVSRSARVETLRLSRKRKSDLTSRWLHEADSQI